MDLQITSKSYVPIHVQLAQQIKHLILAGSFEVRDRLPSIRAMAGFLRVNRNMVARVFSDLERVGFVESRRGSGLYVLEPPVNAVEMKGDVLDRVMDLAAAQGLPVKDLAYAVLARAAAEPPEKARILFVECTREELDQFSDELEQQLPVTVERVLLEDLAQRASLGKESPPRVAVTTFFHVHEVQDPQTGQETDVEPAHLLELIRFRARAIRHRTRHPTLPGTVSYAKDPREHSAQRGRTARVRGICRGKPPDHSDTRNRTALSSGAAGRGMRTATAGAWGRRCRVPGWQ